MFQLSAYFPYEYTVSFQKHLLLLSLKVNAQREHPQSRSDFIGLAGIFHKTENLLNARCCHCFSRWKWPRREAVTTCCSMMTQERYSLWPHLADTSMPSHCRPLSASSSTSTTLPWADTLSNYGTMTTDKSLPNSTLTNPAEWLTSMTSLANLIPFLLVGLVLLAFNFFLHCL